MVTVRHAPASAGEVRRQLGADLDSAGLPPAVIGDATLVVSELVGNSVRYAPPLPGGVLEVGWTVDPTASGCGSPTAAAQRPAGTTRAPRTSAAAGWRSSPRWPGTGASRSAGTATAR